MNKVYSFEGNDAAKYGLPAAILLHHIRWWIAKNEANGKHQHDGRTWTYNSRKAFTKLFPFLTEKQVRSGLDRLVKDGVLIKGNYNKSSYDRTSWYALSIGPQGPMEVPLRANGSDPEVQPIPVHKTGSTTDNPLRAGCSFGMDEEKPDNTTTEFDRAMAATLEAAVRKLPPRKTWIKFAKPRTWTRQMTTLRIKYGVSEQDIETAMKWYAANIGGSFVPEAYSGSAFVKKFPAILRRAKKHEDKTTAPGKTAKAIARRYGAGLNGSAKYLPGAVQVVLDRYGAWRKGLLDLLERVKRNDLTYDYRDKTRKRRHMEGAELLRSLPTVQTYAEQWAERTVRRVAGWDGWSGDFAPFLFDPDGKDFQAMCLSHLQRYAGDRGGEQAWKKLKEMMKNEGD